MWPRALQRRILLTLLDRCLPRNGFRFLRTGRASSVVSDSNRRWDGRAHAAIGIVRVHLIMSPEFDTSPAEIAATRRDELAAEWLTATQVGKMLKAKDEDSSQMSSDGRRAGKLLGVWVSSEHAYRYPPWQFRADGTLVPQMREILRLLREHGGVIDQGRCSSGWNEVEWFMTPHLLLHGQTPANQLAANAEQVFRAAHTEFVEDADTNAW